MATLTTKIFTHWQHNEVKKNDTRWWNIIRSHPAAEHSQAAEQMAEFIAEGYHHPKFDIMDCLVVCDQQIQACSDPHWDTIMSKSKRWIYKPHDYKETQWKFWRMTDEILTEWNSHTEDPKHQLFTHTED